MAALVMKGSLLFLVIIMAALHVSMGAVYHVGGDAGWTMMGDPDYEKWAASKTFHVGDTIVFQYNPKYHNVIQVNQHDYTSCNATSGLATTYTTGYDSITIQNSGHYYFLCGIPGHCQAGMKVDIKVADPSPLRPTSAASPSSSSTRAAPRSMGPFARAPSPSSAASLIPKGLLAELIMFLLMFVGFSY